MKKEQREAQRRERHRINETNRARNKAAQFEKIISVTRQAVHQLTPPPKLKLSLKEKIFYALAKWTPFFE